MSTNMPHDLHGRNNRHLQDPASFHQIGVPAQERPRGDEQALPTASEEQPRERGNNRPVRPRRPGNGDLATKHRELMP
jgi:hypothetical protein